MINSSSRRSTWPPGRAARPADSDGTRDRASAKRGRPVIAREASTAGSSQLLEQVQKSGPDHATSTTPQGVSSYRVEQVLRTLPSHGWTAGWIGRRDRALLVLSQMAGLPFDTIADLTVADVTVRDGIATIRTAGGTTTLRKNDDDLICAPCALARWLHALDMTVVYSSCRVSTAVLARAAPLTSHSPHLCQGNVSVTESTRRMTLLPAIDQYGPLAEPRLMGTSTYRPVRSPAGRIPAQRVTTARATALPLQEARRLAVASTGHGQSSDGNDVLARGLEGRTRFLLELRSGSGELH